MENRKWKALKAIHNLTSSLKDVFPKEMPILLYERLLSKIGPNDEVAINAQIDVFNKFFEQYSEEILEGKQLPEGTKIAYNSKIYINIASQMSRLNEEEVKTINSHLLTIYAILEPKGMALDKLEKCTQDLPINKGTNEGKFLSDIFDNAKNMLDGKNQENPTAAIMGIMQSFPAILNGLQNGVSSGNLDPQKLFGEMHNTLGSLMQMTQNSMAQAQQQPSQQSPPQESNSVEKDTPKFSEKEEESSKGPRTIEEVD